MHLPAAGGQKQTVPLTGGGSLSAAADLPFSTEHQERKKRLPPADGSLRRSKQVSGKVLAARKMAAEIRLLHAQGNTAELLVVIHEGKNRQIRRMCEAVELRVTRLRRIREGTVSLGDLPSGSWRDLTAAEIAALQE